MIMKIDGFPWAVKDAEVCVTGWGEASGYHQHDVIERLTATMIVLKSGQRFRYSDSSMNSVPYNPYAGKYLRRTLECQHRPVEQSRV